MANGGWHGKTEEWDRLQAPLIAVDPILAKFTAENSLQLTANAKERPERSIRWGDEPSGLIQIFLADENVPLWNLWLCASEDRGDERYLKSAYALESASSAELAEELEAALGSSLTRVKAWMDDPQTLKFATKIAKL